MDALVNKLLGITLGKTPGKIFNTLIDDGNLPEDWVVSEFIPVYENCINDTQVSYSIINPILVMLRKSGVRTLDHLSRS